MSPLRQGWRDGAFHRKIILAAQATLWLTQSSISRTMTNTNTKIPKHWPLASDTTENRILFLKKKNKKSRIGNPNLGCPHFWVNWFKSMQGTYFFCSKASFQIIFCSRLFANPVGRRSIAGLSLEVVRSWRRQGEGAFHLLGQFHLLGRY